MNLLLFNLATDAKHVTLASGLRWLEELARYFQHIDVVTMYEGEHRLPPNVRVWSVGREKGYSRYRRVLRFYRVVLKVVQTRQIDVAFTYMIHSFAVLFWPIGLMFRIKNVLWYAHRATPLGLRLAHLLVGRVVSSTPEGFRLRSNKVHFVGQGIDVSIFNRVGVDRDPTVFRIISVGRIAPIKGLDILLDSLLGWTTPDGRPWELHIIGAATSDTERAYEKEVIKKCDSLRRYGTVHNHGRLNQREIAALLKSANVFVNLSGTGSLDRAIVEAMATGCPVLSCNDAFRSIAEHASYPEGCIARSASVIPDALKRIAQLDQAARLALEERMYELVVSNHSLDGLIRQLIAILKASAKKGTCAA